MKFNFFSVILTCRIHWYFIFINTSLIPLILHYVLYYKFTLKGLYNCERGRFVSLRQNSLINLKHFYWQISVIQFEFKKTRYIGNPTTKWSCSPLLLSSLLNNFIIDFLILIVVYIIAICGKWIGLFLYENM